MMQYTFQGNQKCITGVKKFILVISAAAVATGTSSCGNAVGTDINGKLGISVDSSGNPVVVAELCHGEVSEINLFPPNHSPLKLHAAPAKSTSFIINLAHLKSPWKGRSIVVPLAPGRYQVEGNGGQGADSALSDVVFDSDDLSSLRADKVQYSGYDPKITDRSPKVVVDKDLFHSIACARAKQ